MIRTIFQGAALALALATPGGAEAGPRADAFTGTWRLDPAISVGVSGIGSQQLTIEVKGGRERYRSELVDSKGQRQVTDYEAAYDGVEYPSQTVITDPGAPARVQPGTVTLRRIDALNSERLWRRDGQIFRVLRRTVSDRGRLLTSRLTDVSGAATADGTVLVFRRIDHAARAFHHR